MCHLDNAWKYNWPNPGSRVWCWFCVISRAYVRSEKITRRARCASLRSLSEQKLRRVLLVMSAVSIRNLLSGYEPHADHTEAISAKFEPSCEIANHNSTWRFPEHSRHSGTYASCRITTRIASQFRARLVEMRVL